MMNDEQKKAYSANWIVKFEKKSYIHGVNAKPLYLTNEEATPLLALGAITEFDESTHPLTFSDNPECP